MSEQKRKRGTGLGLAKGLSVTLKTMLQPAVTQQYPRVKPDLPPRTRGVIALKEANCTVCYKCSRECPDWCIYIDAHKETHDPAGGGRARSQKVLDRFAIDYALCMYCGICVEVCPFDALFWSPEFEYGEYDLDADDPREGAARGLDVHGPAASVARGGRAARGGTGFVTAQEYAFAVIAAVGSISAIAVVTARNVVHAALYLVVALLSVGATFLLLGAEFAGWVQILIYVGAIVILFLFGLMLTKAPIGRDTLDNNRRWLGRARRDRCLRGPRLPDPGGVPVRLRAVRGLPVDHDRGVGDSMFRDYVLPFEAISFLLLAALIGAIVLARKDEGN